MTPKEITEKIIGIVAKETASAREDIKPETQINDNAQLGIDSMDFIDILMEVEEKFCIEIKDEESEKLATVADVARFVEEFRKR